MRDIIIRNIEEKDYYEVEYLEIYARSRQV